MVYYYIFVVFAGLVFYALLLFLKKKIPGLSSRVCLLVVLWALALSFALPGIISVLPPAASLLIIFSLFFAGGFLIVYRTGAVTEDLTEESVETKSDETTVALPGEMQPALARVTETVETAVWEQEATPLTGGTVATTEQTPLLYKEMETAAAAADYILTEAEIDIDTGFLAEAAAKTFPDETLASVTSEGPEHEADDFIKQAEDIPAAETETVKAPLEKEVLFFKKYAEPLLLPRGEFNFKSGKEVSLLSQQELPYHELIESAFQAREEGNYELAADKLRQSLEGTADLALKGMIYTELVFLYKEMGKYLEAAGMIQGFISENGAALDPPLVRQFTSLVNYLQTVDQLLKKAEQPGAPYSQVPRLIKLRAEKLLKE